MISQLDVDAADVLLLDAAHPTAGIRRRARLPHRSLRPARPAAAGRRPRRAAPRSSGALVAVARPARTTPADSAAAAAGSAEGFVAYYWRAAASPKARSRACWKSSTARRSTPTADGWTSWRRWPARRPSPSTTPACSTTCSAPTPKLALAYDATIEGWSRGAGPARQGDRGPQPARHRDDPASWPARWASSDARAGRTCGAARCCTTSARWASPTRILLKPGPLTDEEWVIMRQHPQLRLRAARAHRLPAAGAGHPLLPPREVGRQRLPARPQGRADPAGRPHLRRGGCLGRPALRPPLPPGLARRAGARIHPRPAGQALRPRRGRPPSST